MAVRAAVKLGAWVSHQSEVIDARRILDARLAEMTERFAGQTILSCPRTGVVIGSCRRRLNSGRAAPTACTTGFAMRGKRMVVLDDRAARSLTRQAEPPNFA